MDELEREIEEDISLKPYVIPKNINTRFEIFEGFGMRELAYIGLTGLIGLCLGLIIWFFTKQPGWMGLAIPTGSIGFFFGKPNPRTGRNSFDLIRDIRRFNAKPKRYYYKFGDGRGD